MKKLIKILVSKIKFIILIYALIQLVMILNVETSYKSDALYYYKLAQECIEQNEFYPAQQHLYEDYIIAPLYINVLIILLTIYNSTFTISLFNFFIILLQITLLYKITQRIFSNFTAKLTILFFVFYLNTSALMLQNYTELFFLLLITASIYFYLLNKNIYLLLSGICLGGAISVRPLGWALFCGLVVIQIFTSIRNKKIVFQHMYIYTGTLIFIILFGGLTFLHFNKFEFASTTGPVNLLLGANDDATGGFNSAVLEKGKAGYIEYSDSSTYIQKGEFYQDQAIRWITDNPLKWLSLAPLKLFHSFGWDDVSLSFLLGHYDTNFLRVVKIHVTEKDFNIALPNTSTLGKVLYYLILFSSHLYYYFLLFAIAGGIYYLFKQNLHDKTTILIYLFIFFSTLMIVITVGTPRYKYPMFILLLPFAASYVEMKFGFGKQSIERN